MENRSELWLLSPGRPDLLLTGENFEAGGPTYTINALDDGVSWGAPTPIDTAVQRWLADGAVAATQGHDNREITFGVRLSGLDPADLAAAESALAVRAGAPCLLKWIPPSGQPDAPASVFEVWTWHLSHEFDGLGERRLERTYTLTFTAKPWVRSEALTVVAALPTVASPTTLTVDSCSSLTNWTGSGNLAASPSPSLFGGGIQMAGYVSSITFGAAVPTSVTTVKLIRTAHVEMGSQPYLVIDYATTGNLTRLNVTVDGQQLTRIAALGTTTYWQMPTGKTSFDVLTFLAVFGLGSDPITLVYLNVNDISKTDTPGGVGSRKQLFRNLTVGGSVKTSGSIQVASPDATPLGTALVYTRSANGSGYIPAMRRYRSSGGLLTADATCVSGFRERIATGGASTGSVTFVIPANQLREGTYALLVRLLGDTAATFDVYAAASSNGINPVSTPTFKVTMPVGFAWAPIGSLSLPTQQLPIESGVATYVAVGASGGTGTLYLDELYILDLTHGDASVITVPATHTRLWIDAPDNDAVRNRPAVYTGIAADRSDAVGVTAGQIISLGAHDLDPEGSAMLTVTDNVNDAAVTASFYRRGHTHPTD